MARRILFVLSALVAVVVLVGGCVALWLGGSVAAQEWSRFRGLNGKGESEATTIPVTWTD